MEGEPSLSVRGRELEQRGKGSQSEVLEGLGFHMTHSQVLLFTSTASKYPALLSVHRALKHPAALSVHRALKPSSFSECAQSSQGLSWFERAQSSQGLSWPECAQALVVGITNSVILCPPPQQNEGCLPGLSTMMDVATMGATSHKTI